MADEKFTVRHHVAEDGRVYLELAGLKEWIAQRVALRDAVRTEAISAGKGDPGPVTASHLLGSLNKVADGR